MPYEMYLECTIDAYDAFLPVGKRADGDIDSARC